MADVQLGASENLRLGRLLRKRLVNRLVADGATEAEAEEAMAEAEGDYSLLDMFIKYGLPFILNLLKSLIASKKA